MSSLKHDIKDGLHYLIVNESRGDHSNWHKVVYDETRLLAIANRLYIDSSRGLGGYRNSAGDASLLDPEEVAQDHNTEIIERSLVGVTAHDGPFVWYGFGIRRPEFEEKLARYRPPMMKALLVGEFIELPTDIFD